MLLRRSGQGRRAGGLEQAAPKRISAPLALMPVAASLSRMLLKKSRRNAALGFALESLANCSASVLIPDACIAAASKPKNGKTPFNRHRPVKKVMTGFVL